MRASSGRTLATALAAATLTVGLAACGSGSGGSGGGSSRTDLNTLTDQQLYAKAKSEGQLTWYTSMPQDDLPRIAAAFQKVYPGVKVNPLYLSGQTPVTRIESEARAGSPTADVVSGSGDAVLLEQAGLIDTSYNPKDAPTLPAGLKLPSGLASDRIITNVITFSPTALKAAGLTPPTSYEDLTKLEWRGKFSIDPTTADIVNALGPQEGVDKVIDLAKRLGANKPVFVTSHSLAVSQIASGANIAAASSYGQTALVQKQKAPDKIDFVNPNPLPVLVSEIAVVKNDPHPAAARLFMDWMASKAGQDEVVSLGLTSVRTDADNDPSVWNPSKWTPYFEDVSTSTATLNKQLAEWQQALGYSG